MGKTKTSNGGVPEDPQATMARQIADKYEALLTSIRERFAKAEGGPLDGLDVLSLGNFDEEVRAWRSSYEAPIPSAHAAAMLSPARVELSLVCPECGETAPGVIKVTTVLTSEGHKRTLKAKGTTATVDHVHGQQSLPESDETGTVPAFDIEDIVGDDDAEDDAEA